MTTRISISINKIQNWFKYQRKNEFLSKKAILKSYRVTKKQNFFIKFCFFRKMKRKHKFGKNEKKLLENSFRVNNALDEKTLAYLYI